MTHLSSLALAGRFFLLPLPRCFGEFGRQQWSKASDGLDLRMSPFSVNGQRQLLWRSYPSLSVVCSAHVEGIGERHQKHAVVVGAGWGGLGAAQALQKAGVLVTVLEAGDSVGGLSTVFRTEGGKAVEPGIKGFWHQYRNIEALLAELNLQHVLTDWTESGFYSKRGLQAQSRIFKDLPRLPAPLGSFLYTAPYFTQLPLADRLSAINLVQRLLEHDIDEERYAYFDSITARQLFSCVSPRLYREFLEPMLLVTLFAPGDKLSAAAALGCLYYFALAHQSDFDVRWCKGPVGERIIKPWAAELKERGVQFRTGKLVQQVLPHCSDQRARVITKSRQGQIETWDADTVILSASVPALQRIVSASPALQQRREFAVLSDLTAIDVMAIRLWLDRQVKMPTPSNVVTGFDAEVGATFFDLTTLQEEYHGEPGSVVEVDFYNASQRLMQMSDLEAVNHALGTYLAGSLPAFAGAAVKDFSVNRAVTCFSPGSAACLPRTATSLDNVFMAGDFVWQGPGTHGAKGLSQEKAFVAGLEAGNQAVTSLGLQPEVDIIPIEPDELHVQLGKAALRAGRLRSSQSSWQF